MPTSTRLPVAVIGAGPVGLAAAVHLLACGETPVVFEAAEHVGAAIRQWGHVRLFSPWKYVVDRACVALLEPTGWALPDAERAPTGAELVSAYLEPLAALPALASALRLGARVIGITRQGRDKLKDDGRDDAPFVLRVRTAAGEERVLAKAVIDASGTYGTPNPLGADGLPASGEAAAAAHLIYGIPDVLSGDRARYAGRRVAVVGSGHSAFNALLDLVALAQQEPRTLTTWVVRRAQIGTLFGGEAADALPDRGALGTRARHLLESGAVQLAHLWVAEVRTTAAGVILVGEDGATVGPVDEVIVTTGFRPDLAPLRELRLDLHPSVEAPRALAPLIDPNLHSCGTVPPHGAAELQHPECDFYVVGMKSYGRAPTFLLLTGYEQVRSVAAAIAGDWDAARRVDLVLPETGVCSTDAGSCCDAPASPPLLQIDGLASLPVLAGVASPARPPRTELPVVHGSGVGVAACCPPAEQQTCCEPDAKSACCGTAAPGTCGCR